MDLFVYGTLMFSEIRDQLLGRTIESQKATAKGYKTVCIKYENDVSTYPVLIRNNNSETQGVFLKDLTQEDIRILNFYEGEEYELKEILVDLKSTRKKALVYLPKHLNTVTLGPDWDINFFRLHHFTNYVEKIIPETIEEFRQISRSL